MKYSYLFLILTLLAGCSTLDVAKGVAGLALGEQPTLAVDAQLGDKTANVGTNDNSTIDVEDNEGIVTVTSTKSEKNFEKANDVTINEGPDIWYLIILVLGWLLPSPSQMYGEVKSWFIHEK